MAEIKYVNFVYFSIWLLCLSAICSSKLLAQEELDTNKVICKIKATPQNEFLYNLSMPILDENSNTNWNIKYIVLLQDTVLQNFCSQETSKLLIQHLIKLLEYDKYVWQANLMLYSITKVNAIELETFVPNKINEWSVSQKEEDILFWKNYKF